ncbi:MAG: hypothetical protein HY052_03305 [Proteobacteria bacterium]|nr:hypothetical protein [Pseudomonadota bacterium]
MGKLWHRVANDQGKFDLREVDMSQLKIDQPTIVYLSGFLTNNNRPGYVAGGIKCMEELLRNRPECPVPPKVYAWSHSGLRNLFNLAVYNTFPSSRSSQAGYDIGAGVLMPLVTKGFAIDKRGHVSGTPIPLEEAKKNVMNVTLFGYSAGAIVAQETFNATLKMMKDVGYNEKDAREVLNEVVLVATGVFSRYTKEANRFTTLYLAATNDRMMRAKNWIWGTTGTLLRTTFTGYANKQRSLTVRPLSDTSVYITAPVRPSDYEWKYDDSGRPVEKKHFGLLYPRWTGLRSYHELQHYLTTDEKNNSFANIALYALINAVNRQGTVKPMDLIQPPPANQNASEAYRAKIAAAIRPMPQSLKRKNP